MLSLMAHTLPSAQDSHVWRLYRPLFLVCVNAAAQCVSTAAMAAGAHCNALYAPPSATSTRPQAISWHSWWWVG